ncbi:MAG: NAD(P)/FAD-dependent oxidoreductase [Lentimicrobium sp.]|jgi:NADH dehydrogenase|nr:NAD(P)/FAD-dependent oxidoreductase [Lentimicrobium sp.]
MSLNIPDTSKRRLVVIGGGFAGLKLVEKLKGSDFQIVLIDRNNFHQFQPLFYQVATAGLEPSAIAFPLRRMFQKSHQVIIRLTEVKNISVETKTIHTDAGDLTYDLLVMATGAATNFFGMQQIQERAFGMKTVGEALGIRNTILKNYELALIANSELERNALMNIVIVGGGPTGVELSGALADMRKYVLPKDFPDLDFRHMQIFLVEASPQLLNGMSQKSSAKATHFLKKLGVNVLTDAQVTGYEKNKVTLKNGNILDSKTVIWAAGVSGDLPPGFTEEQTGKAYRLKVDPFNRLNGLQDVFAIGDIALMDTPDTPHGHPQVAQVALQQAKNLASNLRRINKNTWKPFRYTNKGSMATIGRNKAVVDLPFIRFQGAFAWFVWMFVHLISIIGVKNKLFIFINWVWNYVTYDQSLRLIIRQHIPKKD